MLCIEVMPDRDTHQEDKRRNDPGVLRSEGQWIMARQHQEYHRQCQIIVMRRPQLGDLTVLRVRTAPGLQVGNHDALVRHDDEEDIGRHDRRRHRTQMQQGGAPGKDLIERPTEHDDPHKQN